MLLRQRRALQVYSPLFKWWTLSILHPDNRSLIYDFCTYCFYYWHRFFVLNENFLVQSQACRPLH
nr:MAG TPA: hypothetical protein [Caudoviricetes sp.]